MNSPLHMKFIFIHPLVTKLGTCYLVKILPWSERGFSLSSDMEIYNLIWYLLILIIYRKKCIIIKLLNLISPYTWPHGILILRC